MLKKLLKKLKLNNKGISLVEILCAISILSIAGATISSALVTSSRNYQRGVSEINVQQESQFLRNQLSNLIINATGEVVFDNNRLTIKNSDVEYGILFKPEDEVLYYYEDNNTSDLHILAEGVSYFDVDTSNFKRTRSVYIKTTLQEGGKRFDSAYTVTSRNGVVEPAVIPPSINCVNEIILEPNQEYTFEATVSNLDNPGLDYKIALNKDENTKISTTGKIKIGPNETSRLIHVTISSKEKDNNGNPKATKNVRVYVRRVTSMSLYGSCTSGTNKMAGSVYTLDVSIYGNNLNKLLGNQTDLNYVNPYSIEWKITSNATNLYQIIQKDDSKLVFKLKRDMAPGEKINITATACHPNGTNKTSFVYDDSIKKDWQLKAKLIYLVLNDNDIKRFTDERQGYYTQAFDDLATNELTKKYVYRFKALDEENWTQWFDNFEGDGNDSMDINFRPNVTASLDYRKTYLIQIKISIIDSNGNNVWPTNNEDEDDYIYEGIMNKVGIFFKSNLLGLNDVNKNETSKEIKVQKGNPFDLIEISKIVGYRESDMKNYLNYILEKKIDGKWVIVPSEDASIQKGNSCKIKFEKDNFEGEYRVKVYVPGMDVYEILDSGEVIKTDKKEDFILYDEETGDGIFYFTAIK